MLAVSAIAVLVGCSSGHSSRPPVEQDLSVRPTQETMPSATSSPSKSTSSGPSTPSTSPTAQSLARPPYIASAMWTMGAHGRSLHVTPTASGRTVTSPDAETKAWTEVLKLHPDAGTVSMYRQFSCHWKYARDKAVWNLEPWRPVVPMDEVVAAYCNPGGPE